MNGSHGRLTGRMAYKLKKRVEPELRAIDSKLFEYAGRYPVPEGLSWRTYQASVGLLPTAESAQRPRPWRLQPMSPASIWGRLAMAASIGLAFIVAGTIGRVGSRTRLAALSPDVELVLLDLAGLGDADHLWITQEMTFRDLTGDVAAMAVDLKGRDM